MSDKENMTSKLESPNSSTEVSFLKVPNKVLKVRNDGCQATPTKEPLQNKITVEYERVGSFQVFETVCPLEFCSMNPSPTITNKVEKLSEMTSRGKSEKHVKHLKKHKTGVQPLTNLDSEGSAEDDEDFNHKLRTAEPQKIQITLDAFFRSENSVASSSAAGDATVFWVKGQNINDDDQSGSDLDPEIGKYIRSQKDKKKRGESLTSESLWYDQERSIIRNLHENGSISLTSYGDTDERIFGKTEIFDSIMTTEERAMLKAREPEEEIVIIKPEKKKKPLETRKKVKKCSRPKDQGDWV